MNAAIKAAWLAALRSGDYRQGHNQLRDNGSFCCLGVLCDLAARAGIGRWQGQAFLIGDGDTVAEYAVNDLPGAVVEWAGVPDFNPNIEAAPLSIYNDGSAGSDIRPHTFAEIADLIEAHL